ncbi:Twin-arginine translocation protein TatB [Labilithrix luteola]|uniref:Twin-arginine translocation protein TatB n=1 Tax=Labilithrix luteola TaxID=1391654 RepID=A0A0K1QAF1_9BACT|nr:Twin-arginine translocation protein TatB [Labilithrix luteola]
MVIVVALVVIGPKDLPKMLRKLGQMAGKLRRMASELRAQSGIDEALRSEGLADDIAEIRKLARGELDAVQKAATLDMTGLTNPSRSSSSSSSSNGSSSSYGSSTSFDEDLVVARDREYPRDGADSFGALPDNAIIYAEGLPKSPLARDPLYVVGDANAELPPEPVKTPPETEAASASSDEPPKPVPYGGSDEEEASTSSSDLAKHDRPEAEAH